MAWSFVPFFLIEGFTGVCVYIFIVALINYFIVRYLATITIDSHGITLKRCMRKPDYVSWDAVKTFQKVFKHRGIFDIHLSVENRDDFKFSPSAFQKERELVETVIFHCKNKIKDDCGSLYLLEDKID